MKKNLLLPEIQWSAGAVFTIGHSTLPIESFIATLEAYVERDASILDDNNHPEAVELVFKHARRIIE